MHKEQCIGPVPGAFQCVSVWQHLSTDQLLQAGGGDGRGNVYFDGTVQA